MPTTGNSKRQCITDSGLVYLSEEVEALFPIGIKPEYLAFCSRMHYDY